MTSTNSNHHYNRNLKPFARKLRNNSTLAEVVLWDKVLKKKQLRGYQFLRQRAIGNYIVDFFSKDLKLIIELDGKIHKFQKSKDKKREEELIQLGFSVIRFDNEDILNAMANVKRTLEDFVDDFERKNSNCRKIEISPLNPLKGRF